MGGGRGGEGIWAGAEDPKGRHRHMLCWGARRMASWIAAEVRVVAAHGQEGPGWAGGGRAGQRQHCVVTPPPFSPKHPLPLPPLQAGAATALPCACVPVCLQG